jgi:hypothetical protein
LEVELEATKQKGRETLQQAILDERDDYPDAVGRTPQKARQY